MAGIVVKSPGTPPLTNVLTDTHIFVGDAANVPQDVALTLNPTGGAFALANTGALTMPNANATTRGLLTAADWTTFNNKQNAIPDWTTAFNSGTQATSSWTATNAAANVNAAIIPKGTGALIAQIPDGTTTGGNARGSYAVDLQMSRTAADQVASGSLSGILSGERNRISSSRTNTFSVIGGGQNNVISQLFGATIAGGQGNTIGDNDGWQCTIGGGSSNTITGRLASTIVGGNSNAAGNNFVTMGGRANTANGDTSTLMGGQGNTASGSFSSILGGGANTSSGSNSVVVGGSTNTASGSYSLVPGGLNANASLYGQEAHASGRFATNGDAQAHELVWRRLVTGAPVGGTELFLDGASIAAILPSTNAVWHGIIDISAICTATGNGTTVTGDVQATSYKVTIKRIGTTTSLVGTVQEIGTTNADASMATGVFTIDNNDTNESLRIVYTSPVTAGSTTTIRVVATFRGLQIQY